MFQYTCLNPISHVGLDLLTDDYKRQMISMQRKRFW